MKLENINVCHSLATSFASLMFKHKDKIGKGEFTRMRFSATDTHLVVNGKQEAAHERKLSADELKVLRVELNQLNALGAIQSTFPAFKWAMLGDLCAFAGKAMEAVENKVEPIVSESAPVTASTKKEKKAA